MREPKSFQSDISMTGTLSRILAFLGGLGADSATVGRFPICPEDDAVTDCTLCEGDDNWTLRIRCCILSPKMSWRVFSSPSPRTNFFACAMFDSQRMGAIICAGFVTYRRSKKTVLHAKRVTHTTSRYGDPDFKVCHWSPQVFALAMPNCFSRWVRCAWTSRNSSCSLPLTRNDFTFAQCTQPHPNRERVLGETCSGGLFSPMDLK